MSSLLSKSCSSVQHSAGLGFFWWCFCLPVQLKIKVTINNPIYPVLKWFGEWCPETGTNNIQAEMHFEILKCMILEMSRVQAQQAAASLPAECQCCCTEQSQTVMSALLQRGLACARWDWLGTGVATKEKCTHMFYLGIFSCHVNPMGTERWLEPREIFTFLIMTNDKHTLFCGLFAITIS